jgi:predicted DNA binding protein
VAWTVIAPRSDNIGRLIARLKEMGCEVEMLGLRDQEEDGPLTYHQEKVLRTAYDLGYYDIPRTATLADLSNKLGMARSTIDVVLRRAERRLISKHIGR